jgi:hypothetical protein
VFEVILEAHLKLKHARDTRKNKKCINDDLGYYGVPEQAAQCFIDTCPTASYILYLFIHVFSFSSLTYYLPHSVSAYVMLF